MFTNSVFTNRFGATNRLGSASGWTDDEGTPVGINVAVGAVAIVAAMFIAAVIPAVDAGWRCAVVAAAMGVFAALTVDPLALAALVPSTWLVMNGFLVNRLGNLSWHGASDGYRFLALTVLAGLGLAVGALHRRRRDLRAQWHLGMAVELMRSEFDEEMNRSA